MKSRISSHVLGIIEDTPYPTSDLQQTYKYLENIIINETTLNKIDVGELVTNINNLLQIVEVLSVYKAPCLKMIELYKTLANKLTNQNGEKAQKILDKLNLLDDIMASIDLDKCKLKRKKYWRDYE